jgi:hypothetical protein
LPPTPTTPTSSRRAVEVRWLSTSRATKSSPPRPAKRDEQVIDLV